MLAWTYVQREPVVCLQCGSTVRLTPDHCVRCLLSEAIGVSGDTSGNLDNLLSSSIFQDAECVAPHLTNEAFSSCVPMKS
jgi:hypothetical protein